ncbi:hypothetical protein CPAR01_08560 [Colletotrichum paranaense]|uniref:Uncharacterized protein n=2 Tax=Colletotrichum acutatum species complex TaxID=2707335 RepID=A0AAI9UBM2_9PEZI|nr:uncharacterized protein CPAR01_08560 [Colletotrichum paranaense]KAK1453984.1 hypothetical protein CMEL01_05643 [Colletotrichum melonis]KAK1538447.1 hypothetical protein CPAR01_08560 [Colletotrichum paranaense]
MSLIPDAHHPFLSSWSCSLGSTQAWHHSPTRSEQHFEQSLGNGMHIKVHHDCSCQMALSSLLLKCMQQCRKEVHGWRSCMTGHAAHGRPSRRWIPTLLRDEIGQDPATARHDPHTRGLAQPTRSIAHLRLAPWVGLLSVCCPDDESKGHRGRGKP